MKPLKITVVGDGMVGKTCMLITYVQNAFPDGYVPTVFDNHACNITVDGKDYSLTLWDTAGQEEYERLRPLSYPNTDCFIVCYAIDIKTSFDNVLSKWVPELKHYSPHSPIVLVGTKRDMRIEGAQKFVTEIEGKRMKAKIGAVSFLECSARLKENLQEVFEEAVRATEKKSAFSRVCPIV